MAMMVFAARGFAAALLVVSTTALAQTQPNALDELNFAARAAYADGRAALLARSSPVIVVAFDQLILIRDGKETREPFTPPVYHQLKSVAHLPLGLVTLLLSETPGAREGAWRARLQELRDRGDAADATIDSLSLSATQRKRQHKIFADSRGFIDSALAMGVPDEAALNGFARAIGPALLANAYDAASAQLDALHGVAQRLKRDMSREEWDRIYVLVMGGKLPRVGNVQYEYFINALGRGAERRVIYTEGIGEQAKALALLGTVVTDRRAGIAFFDDDTRMERDLLSDAAAAHLLKIFGKLGSD